MKKLSLITIVMICCSSFMYAGLTHTVTFDRSDLEIVNEDSYERFVYKGAGNFDKEGTPELPGITVNLIIPSGNSVSSIKINSNTHKKIDGIFNIYPTQSLIPTSIMAKKPEWVEPDPDIYLSDEVYPKNIVKVISEGYFDGATQIVTLLVSPLQYLPLTGEVWFSEQITFTLDFKNCDNRPLKPTKRSSKNQNIYDRVLNEMVDNSGDISSYQVRHSTEESLSKQSAVQSGPLPAYEYVVITSESLEPFFGSFVSWKKRKGIDIGIVTVEDIFINYDTDHASGITDSAGAIRQYLTDSWHDGTVWVLLGGDDTVVPVRYGAGSRNTYNWDYIIPTDLYYAELQGDWDVDHDYYIDPNPNDNYVLPPGLDGKPRYGEEYSDYGNCDSPEYQPELFVGRLAVSTQSEIEVWFEKTLLYCDNPNNGDFSYLYDVLLTQEDQLQWIYDEAGQMETILETYNSSFNCDIVEEDIKCGKPSYPLGPDVVSKIDEGYGLICFHNHGAPRWISVSTGIGQTTCGYTLEPWRGLWESWDYPPDQGSIINLTETEKYYIIYTEACDVAAFDYNRNPDPDNVSSINRTFMEAFMEEESKGSATFAGNTRYGLIGPSFDLQEEFFDYLFYSSNTMGVAEAASKATSTSHYLNYSHNLFGDPKLDVWIDTPSEFSSVSVTDNTNSITVNAGVSGSDICVSSADDGASYWLSVSDVSSYTFTTSVRPLYITVTKHNYIPYTAVTGGTFTSDEVWFGNMNVLSGCSFTSDASLTLLPGTKVLMDGYFNLSFLDNARLIAEGTEDAPIVFTSSNGTSPKSWKYLYIRTSNNVLSHCEVKYGNYGIFMIGYPSTGNVVENCNIHNNDQGIRMQSNNVDIIDCDIYDNRHNVVTMYNAEIDIEGTHIHDGGRDGIYCYSADLLNIYGCVIENNGNGGTSTRNGIYAGYTDLINLGNSNYPSWYGYNTVRDNYSSEIYSYGTDYIYLYYNSIHDDSGYEVYNSGSTANILAPLCWWGESPPNYSQFYGSIDIPIYLEDQPSWEGTTQSGGLSKSVNLLSTNSESPREKIARLKNIITSNYRSNKADTALTELFCLLRNDYVDNQYRERSNFFSFLTQVYNNAKSDPAGQRALQYMIVWKTLENDYKSAIALSLTGLNILAEPDRMGVMGNLVYLYASNAQFDKAGEYLEEFQKQYVSNVNEMKFLTESIEVMEEMYEEEKRLAKDSTPPHNEDIKTVTHDKFTLDPAFPNPFNATTVIRYQLPKETHVKIHVYNINGQLVQTLVNDHQTAGFYSVNWNSAGLASGIYLYQIVASDFQKVRKCMVIK